MVDALPILAYNGIQAFELLDGVFYTPPSLLNLGMCVCGECGHIMSVDNERCHRCQAPKFIVISKTPKPKLKAVK